MKNFIVSASLVTAVTLLMLSSIALADSSIPTGATVPTGGSNPPLVKAKWETVPSSQSPSLDDGVVGKNWTQVTPPMTWDGNKSIKYWMVVTDPEGLGDLAEGGSSAAGAYVDVTHPDGTFKYQVRLSPMFTSCPEDTAGIAAAVLSVQQADAAGLIKYAPGITLADLIYEIQECSAYVYVGAEVIDYCQMCGEFDWEQRCSGTIPCTPYWYLLDDSNGYTVDAYAFDKSGTMSAKLTNKFEYICTAGVEVDFNKINFGSVSVSSNKWLTGDWTWTSAAGTACVPGTANETTCRAPSVRNVGNIPVLLNVVYDDMGFGYTTNGTQKIWNVAWDARLNESAASYMDPFQSATLAGSLPLCDMEKISFSMHVKKAVQAGGKIGSVIITPFADPAYPFDANGA